MCPDIKDSILLSKTNTTRNIPVPLVHVVSDHSGDNAEEEKTTGKFAPTMKKQEIDDGLTDDLNIEIGDR